jgi:hypothetical protein
VDQAALLPLQHLERGEAVDQAVHQECRGRVSSQVGQSLFQGISNANQTAEPLFWAEKVSSEAAEDACEGGEQQLAPAKGAQEKFSYFPPQLWHQSWSAELKVKICQDSIIIRGDLHEEEAEQQLGETEGWERWFLNDPTAIFKDKWVARGLKKWIQGFFSSLPWQN